MKLIQGIENLPPIENATVTLGTFDGVHLGHKLILQNLIEEAEKVKGESVLLTFWPHPRKVLHPDDTSLKLLNTIEEKIDLLSQTALDYLIILPFTIEFSKKSYLDFVKEIIVDALKAKMMVVGYDHHFGKNREGTFEQLNECGNIFHFGLKEVPALKLGEIAVSSSKIREALLNGRIEDANDMLGYRYSLSGKVIKGKQKGKMMGFPTANMEVDESYKLIPQDGIYIAELKTEDGMHQGLVSIGTNPTFGNNEKTIESYILNFDKEIYNEKIEIFLIKYLRKQIKFAEYHSLVDRMNQDKEEAENFFGIK